MKYRAYTNNRNRTVRESVELFTWMLDKFGNPGKRWSYGKSLDRMGDSVITHCAEIEWIEFQDEHDRLLTALRWGM